VQQVNDKLLSLNPSEEGAPIVDGVTLPQLISAFPARQGIMVWGPPGVGKSDIVKRWASENGKKVFDVRLPLLDPIDLRGIGVPDLERAICRWLPPEFIPRDPNSVLFLDEISAAPPSVQAAAFQLVLDRRIGEAELPADCRVIAAGNRETDRGVSFRMPSPLSNRMTHFTLAASVEAWRGWAIQNGVDPRVISFLTVQPDYLHKLDATNSGQAWASPRSWEFASNLLKDSQNLKPDVLGIAVASAVGTTAARAFIKTLKLYQDLSPKISQILKGDSKAMVKVNDPSQCQTLAVALVSNCPQSNKEVENLIRWCVLQNTEYKHQALRMAERRWGDEYMQTFVEYQDFVKTGGLTNPTGGNRTPIEPPF
jgi:hypothetical protein